MSNYEFDGFRCGDSAYESLSEYRRFECTDGWVQFHSMQAAYKIVGPYVYFKSYDFVCCAYNRELLLLYVDTTATNKSRTTNRQLSRFLTEWVHRNIGINTINDAITEYYNDESDYHIDDMYTAQVDVMSYINIRVCDYLGYQIGE